MPTVQTSAHDPANRRMVIGLLLSLLAHALILSIGFGVSAMRAGGSGPITVSLTPLPPPAAVSDTLPPPTETMPPTAAAPGPVPPPKRMPGSGFRLFDPIPMAPPEPAQATGPKPARRRRLPPANLPQRKATPVIVQEDNPDAAFKVPLADVQDGPVPEASQVEQPEPALAEAEPDPAVEEASAQARAEDRHEAEEEARRLAQQEQEAERLRLADIERIARQREQVLRLAEERATALRQEQAENERAHQREEAAARERLLADEQAARRLQDEQLRRQRVAQERREQDEARTRELAAQRALEQERARLAMAREAERLAAERERAAQQLIEEAARQREAEAARERAQQLAQRQEEERVRRQRAEQAAQEVQEQLARQAAVQQMRQQAHEAAQAERARQAARETSANAGGAGVPGMAPGSSGAGGASPRGTLDGAGLASRAREMMRGIELPGAPPAALRPAQQMMQEGRRRAVDTLERDVPLRLYVDSFRQKIERNAAQIRMQVTAGPGRSDPLVSVALRSDGSVDDVTIVRSSGRADLDEAVRRIVRLNARYAVFPPAVAARFDVIEIRRIWLFADKLKLLEEVR
jgi:TonB family protein